MTISSIFDLPTFVDSLSQEDRDIFDSIFSLSEENVAVSYSSEKSKEYLLKVFHTDTLDARHTLSVTNHVLHQQSLFNPLRANRPLSTQGSNTLEEPSRETCDFCHPVEKTTADPFGRIETDHSITAANAGAYTGMHSLIIPKDIHNPLAVTEEVFLDMMAVANTWWQKAHVHNPKAIYPSLIWNGLGRGGASIFHPHVQIFLTEKPFEKQAAIYNSMQEYQKRFAWSFFDQFIKICKILNLAKNSDEITFVANPTPIKDKEILILGKSTDIPLPSYFASKTYSVISRYIHELGVTNFDFATLLPPLDNSWSDFPIFARLVDRGIDGRPSDIGAMELFFASVVPTDPYSLVPFLS